MTLPTVSELVRGLEPVTRDPFIDGLDTKSQLPCPEPHRSGRPPRGGDR
jgi:hypothetical protein